MRLLCTIFLLLVTLTGLNAAFVSFAVNTGTPAFQGNPNVTITAITPSIAITRTSCNTPCFIQVSASPTTASGTSVPYEELGYSWNFGDINGTEIFTQPIASNGKSYSPFSVNMNIAQSGPEAAYVYRSAGTYTIRMIVYGGPTGAISATTTQVVTVSAFNPTGGEFWFAPTTGNDANSGLDISHPKQSISALNALIADNTQFHVKKGEAWSGTAGILIGGAITGLRIDAYGSGANPSLTITSGSTNNFFMNNGGSSSPSAKSDVVISNVNFISGASATPSNSIVIEVSATGNTSALMRRVYFDNVTITSQNATGQILLCSYGQTTPNLTSECGIWGGTYSNANTGASGSSIGNLGQTWAFVLGASVSGTGSNATLDHHIYPSTQTHFLVSHVTFGTGTTRNYNINTNYDSISGSLEIAQYVCFTDNDMSGTQRAWDGSDSNNTQLVNFQNFVGQRNAIHGFTGNGQILFASTISMTVRDNLVWANAERFFVPNSTALATTLIARLYRNRVYQTAGSGAQDSGVFSFSLTNFTQLQTITDNIVQDNRTSANLVEDNFTSQSGATVNRNQWYFPNDADSKPFYNNGTAAAFNPSGTAGTWQNSGFDLSGSVANPAWVDPANGNFN